jgi:hypothetical protein
MLKYQIRFCDSKGNGYFKYVYVKSKRGVEKKAAEAATKHIIEEAEKCKRANGTYDIWGIFRQPPKPKRTLNVWEWDTENKCVKKRGHRFKLRLAYFQATYTDGSKKREEWYEPVIETKKAK